MLIPSEKTIFENVSSRDYYARASELKSKKTSGCIFLAYPDFEEVVFFIGGEPAVALHETKRWLSVGVELLEPVENKAIASDGRMSAYELPESLLHIFINKKVGTMVETGLGPYMTAGTLMHFLANDKSTCVLKVEDKRSTGYVYINFGKIVGAVYDSPDGRSYGDKAVKEMERLREQTSAAIYFMEFSEKYVKAKAEATPAAMPQPVAAPVSRPMPEMPIPAAPAQVRAPPTLGGKPVAAALRSAAAAPFPALKAGQVRLVVALSEDRSVGLAHRSRQHTLEVLEDHDVAWVDKNTLSTLRTYRAKLVLPGGSEHTVTLKEAAMAPGGYIIIPKKLRDRLSVGRGMTVEVKA